VCFHLEENDMVFLLLIEINKIICTSDELVSCA
jgi:hypothetical protein